MRLSFTPIKKAMTSAQALSVHIPIFPIEYIEFGFALFLFSIGEIPIDDANISIIFHVEMFFLKIVINMPILHYRFGVWVFWFLGLSGDFFQQA